jgi:tol-pal system protein YbgF
VKAVGSAIVERISSYAVNNPALKRGSALLLAAGFSFLAGCASRADLIQVRNTQGQVRAALADQNQDIEDLKRRYEVLRAELSDPKARPGTRAPASDQVLRWLDDLSRRVAALEQAQGLPPGGQVGLQTGAPGEAPIAPPVAPLPGPGTGAVLMPTPVAAADPVQLALAREEASLAGTPVDPEYAAAMQQIRGGDCKQAVATLRGFVRKNAKSSLADNAQYWIGNCYYGQKDFNRAIIELNEVLLKYPKGDKVPAALLLLAEAFKDSGDSIDARLILQKLISDHPSSDEAQQGKLKLQALGE